MGPPFKNAEIAFIGYQPGDWELSIEQARGKGFESGWVTAECHYHVQQWRLARTLRTMFGSALQHCVGLNAVFVRSRNCLATDRRQEPFKRLREALGTPAPGSFEKKEVERDFRLEEFRYIAKRQENHQANYHRMLRFATTAFATMRGGGTKHLLTL